MSEARPAGVAFAGVNPILRVADINAAVDHYPRVLGFKLDWEGREAFGRCRALGVIFFLCQGDRGHPGTWGLDWSGRC